ncbi:MAG: NAD(P)/FAD-dependent oxidoreductase [Pirellula sp.]
MITHGDRNVPECSLRNIGGKVFDLVIVGAGVAGASAAILASQRGLSVLLVDSQFFPRDKVCGGCLNQRAQSFLQSIGLYDKIKYAGAVVIDRLHLQINKYSSQWGVPSMLSVRRSTLDQMLVDHAEHCGTTFIDGIRAKIQSIDAGSDNQHRVVILKSTSSTDSATEPVSVLGRRVVVASGLSRSSLPISEEWPASVMENSRIGLHALVPRDKVPELFASSSPGTKPQLHMLVGSAGYLGICDTDGDCVDLAAAMDPSAVRVAKDIGATVQQVLRECGADSSFVRDLNWQSTPHLTRQSECVAKQNIFLLGDATGYVEPFTGEGMSWAFKGAEALVPLLYQAHLSSDTKTAEKEWNLWITKHRNHRQRISRWVARQSRKAERAKWVLRMCDWVPPIRNQLLHSIMT